MDFRKVIDSLESQQDKDILNMAHEQILRYLETDEEEDLDLFCDIAESMGHLLTDRASPILYRMVEVYINS